MSRCPKFTERFNDLYNKFCKENSGQNQVGFAKKLGLSRPTVGFYLNGDRVPDAEVLLKICDACNVTPDYLLGRSDAPTDNREAKEVCDYTGLSVEAVNILHSMKESECGAAIASNILETEQFQSIISEIPRLGFRESIVREAADYLGSIDEKPEVLYQENADGELELLSGDPIKQKLFLDAQMDLKEYLPELRVQIFEINEMWSDLLETICPTKDTVRAGKKLYEEYV